VVRLQGRQGGEAGGFEDGENRFVAGLDLGQGVAPLPQGIGQAGGWAARRNLAKVAQRVSGGKRGEGHAYSVPIHGWLVCSGLRRAAPDLGEGA
jgi:hypothetical protein